jgi:hypothetical protein
MLQGMNIGAALQQAVRSVEDDYKTELALLAKWTMPIQIKCGQQNPDRSARAFKPSMTFDDYEEFDIEDTVTADPVWPEVDATKDTVYVSPIRTPTAKVLRAHVTLPQDLSFHMPEESEVIEDTLCIEGPHGPFMIPVPEDAKPGQETTYRLGPDSVTVVVPEGAEPGSMVLCEVDGEMAQFTVPEGKAPGDSFESVPPAIMVLIPDGATHRDFLEVPAPDGRLLTVPMPEGQHPGSYFSLHLPQVQFPQVSHVHVVHV